MRVKLPSTWRVMSKEQKQTWWKKNVEGPVEIFKKDLEAKMTGKPAPKPAVRKIRIDPFKKTTSLAEEARLLRLMNREHIRENTQDE